MCCVIALARAGQEAYFAAAGLRDVESGLPWQRDTVARIYSMTKPVTSVALMMLAEEGRFHLEAPLSDFLPEYGTMQALVPQATRIDQTEVAPFDVEKCDDIFAAYTDARRRTNDSLDASAWQSPWLIRAPRSPRQHRARASPSRRRRRGRVRPPGGSQGRMVE